MLFVRLSLEEHLKSPNHRCRPWVNVMVMTLRGIVLADSAALEVECKKFTSEKLRLAPQIIRCERAATIAL
jgi:hypothetical protein